MCGIAGFIAATPHPESKSWLHGMCERIRHRGPDGEGYYLDGPVALGHRRLSIIDLGGGAQPLGNEDGSVQIVFNGEIYNYLDLRHELSAKGHVFRTKSDTEVLVHLFEEEGEGMAERLNGMFAFAIWDGRAGRLLLARDRYGKKPLYYSTEQPGFALCFASELKALRALPEFDGAMRAESVVSFLPFGYIADPHTIYAKVRKLPPAHTLLWTREGTQLRRYWSPLFEPEPSRRFDESMEETLELAADSVERRLMSDVPLGGFLSGGVDSSAVVALMAQRAGRQVKSFSIGLSDPRWDEVRYARMVAARYQTEHHEETVTPSIEELLLMLADHYDEPFADSSAVPTLCLARMTRQHVTVALSGDGADEVFGGYRRYRFAVLEENARRVLPRRLRRSAIAALARAYPKLDWMPRMFRAKATLTGLSRELGDAYFNSMTGFGYGLLEQMLAPELMARTRSYSPGQEFADRFRQYSHLPALQQLQAVDLETYLPGDILVKLDRATMAYSLEARCPWLDYRLGDLAGRFPAEFKLRGGTGKYIFKEMMRAHLPEVILTRPKMGFAVPLGAWFRTSLKPVFEALALDARMEEYLNLNAVRRVWRTHQSGGRDYGRELWSILMLACWRDRHNGRGAGAALAEALAGRG